MCRWKRPPDVARNWVRCNCKQLRKYIFVHLLFVWVIIESKSRRCGGRRWAAGLRIGMASFWASCVYLVVRNNLNACWIYYSEKIAHLYLDIWCKYKVWVYFRFWVWRMSCAKIKTTVLHLMHGSMNSRWTWTVRSKIQRKLKIHPNITQWQRWCLRAHCSHGLGIIFRKYLPRAFRRVYIDPRWLHYTARVFIMQKHTNICHMNTFSNNLLNARTVRSHIFCLLFYSNLIYWFAAAAANLGTVWRLQIIILLWFTPDFQHWPD